MSFVKSIFRRLKGKNAEQRGLSFYLLFCIISVLQLVSSAATSQSSNDQPSVQASKSKVKEGGFWKKFDWWLMCALAIPVILETLDYTGKSFSFFLPLVSPYWNIQLSPLRNLGLQSVLCCLQSDSP